MSKQSPVDRVRAPASAVRTAALSDSEAAQLATTFKALADPVRLRLLSLIGSSAGADVCVCELTPAFNLSQPTISHHLRLLREAGLIDSERRGTWVHYWLLPAALNHMPAPPSEPGPEAANPAGAPVSTPVSTVKEACR